MFHTGEPIQNVTGSADYAEFMIPAVSLEAVGLTAWSLNAGDRIRDGEGPGFLWQIESNDNIRIRLDGIFVSCTCKWVQPAT